MSKIKLYPDSPSKFRLDGVRIAFPVLNEPEQFQGTGKPRYGGTFIIPGGDTAVIAKIKELALALMVSEVGQAKAAKTLEQLEANAKMPYGPGNKKAEYDGFAGNFFIACHSQTAPALFDNVADPSTGKPAVLARPQNRIYAGCFVNPVISLYYQSKWGRLCASVSGVQFAGDGDSFSGAIVASDDEFEAVQPADMDDDLA